MSNAMFISHLKLTYVRIPFVYQTFTEIRQENNDVVQTFLVDN